MQRILCNSQNIPINAIYCRDEEQPKNWNQNSSKLHLITTRHVSTTEHPPKILSRIKRHVPASLFHYVLSPLPVPFL